LTHPLTAVLLLAGGKGSRFHGGIPKQFFRMGGCFLLEYSMQICQELEGVDFFGVVCQRDFFGKTWQLSRRFSRFRFLTAAGSTRQESVLHGLEAMVPFLPQKILVHDGVRPFSQQTFVNVVEGLRHHRCAIPVLPVSETLYRVQQDRVSEIPERGEYFHVQTPQGFDFQPLLQAHLSAKEKGQTHFPDDGSVFFHAGYSLFTVPGDRNNVKITYPQDVEKPGTFPHGG